MGSLVPATAQEPTVHLLCGMPGAGKTTYAAELAERVRAVRFTLDEWMIRLYDLPYDDPAYAERLGGCRELIWDVALQVLATGCDVVLDWNQWSRAQRHEWHGRAQSAGYDVMLHHIDVPVAVALRHLETRRASATVTSHDIPEEALQHFMTIFEAPSTDEGLRICRVSAEAGQSTVAGSPVPLSTDSPRDVRQGGGSGGASWRGHARARTTGGPGTPS